MKMIDMHALRALNKARVRSLAFLCATAVALFATAASASVFVNDGYTDAGRTNGADAQDVPWYALGSPSLAVVSDSAGIGGGNALRIAQTAAYQGIVGNLGSVVTLQDGDSITLSFSWRFSGTTNLNTAGRLRFGICNSGGSLTTTDNATTVRNNDLVYWAGSNPGLLSGTGTLLYRETTGDEIMTGTNFVQIGAAGNSINAGTTAHLAEFTVTRVGTTLLLSASIDGQTVATATDTSPLTYAFDEVAIRLGGGTVGSPLFIDNVLVENYRVAVDDGYTDGSRTAGADPNDIAWYAVGSHSPTVVSDSVLGSGNALRQTSIAAFQGLLGNFQRYTLSDGDRLTLFYNWRFSGTTGLNQSSKMRFGLYDTKATLVSADNSTASQNDVGYHGATNPGLVSGTGTTLIRETGSGAFMSGADITSFGTAGSSINSGTTAHFTEFSITRTGASLQFSAAIDGLLAAVGTDASPLSYSFDEVGILLGSGTVPSPYLIDNVVVEYSAAQVGTPPAGSVTAAMVASRITGPAPLAVHFDAVGTTSTAGIDTFRQVGYSFNFGDPGSGVHSLTGNSRNVSRGGPIAMHLYRTPGTYAAKVSARDSSGGASDSDVSQAQVTITATDPDVHWPNTQTVCLSRTTDHTGAPAGATLLSNVTSWPAWADNRRYLLHAGQDFTSLGKIDLLVSNRGARNVRIHSYGTGSRPIVGEVNVLSNYGDSYTEWPTNVDVIGLNGRRFYNYIGADTLMFLDCVCTNPVNETFAIAAAWDYATARIVGATFTNPRYIYLINCDANATSSSDGTLWIEGGTHVTLQNTRIDYTGQHNLRAAMLYKSLLDNCHFPGHIRHDASRFTFKIHGHGIEANRAFGTWTTPLNPEQRSKFVIFRDGILGATDGNYLTTAGFARQNGDPATPEHIEDAICEGTRFIRCSHPDFSFDWARVGNRITTRGNTVQGVGSSLSFYEIFPPVSPAHSGPYYDNWPAVTTQDPTP